MKKILGILLVAASFSVFSQEMGQYTRTKLTELQSRLKQIIDKIAANEIQLRANPSQLIQINEESKALLSEKSFLEGAIPALQNTAKTNIPLPSLAAENKTRIDQLLTQLTQSESGLRAKYLELAKITPPLTPEHWTKRRKLVIDIPNLVNSYIASLTQLPVLEATRPAVVQPAPVVQQPAQAPVPVAPTPAPAPAPTPVQPAVLTAEEKKKKIEELTAQLKKVDIDFQIFKETWVKPSGTFLATQAGSSDQILELRVNQLLTKKIELERALVDLGATITVTKLTTYDVVTYLKKLKALYEQIAPIDEQIQALVKERLDLEASPINIALTGFSFLTNISAEQLFKDKFAALQAKKKTLETDRSYIEKALGLAVTPASTALDYDKTMADAKHKRDLDRITKDLADKRAELTRAQSTTKPEELLKVPQLKADIALLENLLKIGQKV